MTAEQLLLTGQPHNNQQLFSDHYLNAVLPARPEWNALKRDAALVMEELVSEFARFHPPANEAQTEDRWIRPVLRALGHDFEVQTSLETPGNVKSPDYIFYYDEAKRLENKGKRLNDENLALRAFAVGDAKYWDRKLDVAERTSSTDTFSNKNPSYQIAFYIQHSGLEWGILTNGRLWRLYHRSNAHKLDRFYEVDLPALLESGSVESFLYFYAFFSRRAFDRPALSVSEILRESTDYALSVGESLKAQVFEALRHLGQGFLDYPDNRLEPEPQTLKAIYENSLIVLYRLLFVFYAEARELLPVRSNDTYRQSYSLQAITRMAAREIDLGHTLLPTSSLTWPRLRELFRIIDQGSPQLDVPIYNGGLFDPQHHPFIEQYTIGDAHLRRAIDILARVDGQFIDYRDLAEQHLGTIYEGLLEYHLASIDPEDGWTVDILNDRGERKRTGSYYTPNYIVKYIVEQAVGPVLVEAVSEKTTDREKIDAVLSVNVLDPAMGSGYFLVEATEFIARFLIDLDLDPAAHGGDEPDLAYWKRRVAQNCIYGVDLNPLAVDLAKLSMWLSTVSKDQPLSFLDHHLRTGNSLVGAWVTDLQPQTERKRRRSTRAKRAEEAGQLSLVDDATFARNISTAVDSMWLIEGMTGQTVEEVKEQERVYREMRETLIGRYGRLADLVTATRFGLEIDPGLWGPLADYATGRAFTAPNQLVGWVDEAESTANREHFFHWELEFPEVFFGSNGQPLGDLAGFDAVVGNPPYVRHESLVDLMKRYFEKIFGDVYHGWADLYVYFFSQSLRLLREDGKLGFISSGTFRRLDSGANLRQFLASSTSVEELLDFGETQVFARATTYPAIVVLCKQAPTNDARLRYRRFDTEESDEAQSFPMPQGNASWIFIESNLQRVVDGWSGSTSLRDLLTEKINRGITTGFNQAFVIDGETRRGIIKNDPNSGSIIKPLIRGEDLHPWFQGNPGLWLIFTKRGINIDDYPGVKRYLATFRERLEPKPDDWDNDRQWPGRKAGSYEWYEIQDSVNYYPVFENPRIHSTKVSLYPSFSFCVDVQYAANTSYVMTPQSDVDPYILLAVLNSKVSEYYCRQVFSPKANGYYEVQPGKLEQFPIPNAALQERDVGATAQELSDLAIRRAELGARSLNRIVTDLGAPDRKLNQKLTAWWGLDFGSFRAEIKKVFKREIPVGERDEWETWLAGQRAEHQRVTNEIIRLETDLNQRVYALYDLTPDEIALIEEVTKYEYGEV